MSDRIPPAPRGSGTEGRKLWRSILQEYDLAEHEVALLVRACRVADTCAALQEVVDRDGPLTTTRLGEVKASAAVVELRQQSIVLARLIVALRVPLGDQEDGSQARLQRRGARGVYSIGRAS